MIHPFKFLQLLLLVLLTTNCIAQQKNLSSKLKVAIFIYDGVEILDFAGPSEVFASASIKDSDNNWHKAFEVYTVAVSSKPITSQGFIEIIPDYSLSESPEPDIIVLPGGSTKASRDNIEVLDWIRENSTDNHILLSVCTGAYLLGDVGVLKGKKATTWYGQIDRFRETYPETDVLENVRFVDNGRIITTAGVSAGIDGSLHLVARLVGMESALRTARYMEYDKWEPNDGIVVEKKKSE